MIEVTKYLSKPYARLVVPDESGLYGAQILEFPGCFADGRTPAEAYANLEQAAEAWLLSAAAKGMPIPEPFASTGYSGTVSLRLPKSMHRRAAQMAHRDGVSLNQFLVDAVSERLGAQALVGRFVKELRDAAAEIPNGRTMRVLYVEGDPQLVAGLAANTFTVPADPNEQTAWNQQRVGQRLALPEAK